MKAKLITLVGILLAACLSAFGADDEGAAGPGHIDLPPPRTSGGMPLMTALSNRQSDRAFKPDPLPLQTVSDLLWAAFGVNRPEYGMRTAPSSYNWQDIVLYVFTADGVWTYDAFENRLVGVKAGDHRALAGMQGYVRTAPLSIVYVSDTTRMVQGDTEFSDRYKFMIGCLDAGHISQNVYLFCASEGLGAVARASVDRERFADAFDLPETHNVIFGQTVGTVEENE